MHSFHSELLLFYPLCSTAYCDLVSHLTCFSWAQKEAIRYGEKWSKKWAREKAYMKILAEIPEILERHTVILDKKQFASWKEYLNEYLSKGKQPFDPSCR